MEQAWTGGTPDHAALQPRALHSHGTQSRISTTFACHSFSNLNEQVPDHRAPGPAAPEGRPLHPARRRPAPAPLLLLLLLIGERRRRRARATADSASAGRPDASPRSSRHACGAGGGARCAADAGSRQLGRGGQGVARGADLGETSAVSWLYLGCISVATSAASRLPLGCTPAVSRLHLGCISACRCRGYGRRRQRSRARGSG